MKIATNHEMTNKQEMLIRRIQSGEEVGTWSVQNSDYDDDIFCGTYNQAAKMAKKLNREGWAITGIALIGLNHDLCFDYCYRTVSIEEI